MATAVTTPPTGGDFVARLSNPTAASSAATGDMSDRFLKLLVTQMQNQDPLNPLDNAQVTTQMAQINTVSGIDKLNQSVNAMSQMMSEKLGGLEIAPSLQALNGTLQTLQGQMLQSQAVQGASLVGRTVLLEGSRVQMNQGNGVGAFDLAGPADQVTVEILGPAGQLVGTVDMGAQSAGRIGFSWTSPDQADTSGLSFRVRAQSGANAVRTTNLMADTVSAVSMGGSGIVLELARGGSTAFNLVKAVS